MDMQNTVDPNRVIDINEASRVSGVSQNTLLRRVSEGDLRVTRNGKRFEFRLGDILRFYPPVKDALTTHQAAERLGITRSHIQNLINEGRLRPVRRPHNGPDGCYLIERSEVERFAAKFKKRECSRPGHAEPKPAPVIELGPVTDLTKADVNAMLDLLEQQEKRSRVVMQRLETLERCFATSESAAAQHRRHQDEVIANRIVQIRGMVKSEAAQLEDRINYLGANHNALEAAFTEHRRGYLTRFLRWIGG